MRKRIDIICPGCKNKERATVYDELGIDSLNSVLDRSKFIHECSKCKQKTVLDYSFKFEGHGYKILYTTEEKHEKGYKRICTSFKDTKEKIMIFEDGLNDILIEYFKVYIQKQISRKDELRYDGIVDDTICFYDVDSTDTLGVKKELYDYFLNKFKIKEKDDIEVNNETFIKYIKK